jgi:hypothetical protein
MIPNPRNATRIVLHLGSEEPTITDERAAAVKARLKVCIAPRAAIV